MFYPVLGTAGLWPLQMSGGTELGSTIKSTGCSSREPRFNSQHPHRRPQLSITPLPGDLTPSYRHTCRQNTNVHFKKKRKEHCSFTDDSPQRCNSMGAIIEHKLKYFHFTSHFRNLPQLEQVNTENQQPTVCIASLLCSTKCCSEVYIVENLTI